MKMVERHQQARSSLRFVIISMWSPLTGVAPLKRFSFATLTADEQETFGKRSMFGYSNEVYASPEDGDSSGHYQSMTAQGDYTDIMTSFQNIDAGKKRYRLMSCQFSIKGITYALGVAYDRTYDQVEEIRVNLSALQTVTHDAAEWLKLAITASVGGNDVPPGTPALTTTQHEIFCRLHVKRLDDFMVQTCHQSTAAWLIPSRVRQPHQVSPIWGRKENVRLMKNVITTFISCHYRAILFCRDESALVDVTEALRDLMPPHLANSIVYVKDDEPIVPGFNVVAVRHGFAEGYDDKDITAKLSLVFSQPLPTAIVDVDHSIITMPIHPGIKYCEMRQKFRSVQGLDPADKRYKRAMGKILNHNTDPLRKHNHISIHVESMTKRIAGAKPYERRLLIWKWLGWLADKAAEFSRLATDPHITNKPRAITDHFRGFTNADLDVVRGAAVSCAPDLASFPIFDFVAVML